MNDPLTELRAHDSYNDICITNVQYSNCYQPCQFTPKMQNVIKM